MKRTYIVTGAIPISALAVVMLLAFSYGQPAPETAVPSDADIRQILVDRIDLQHQSVGIVVGIIGPEGRRVIAYGHLEKGDPRPQRTALTGKVVYVSQPHRGAVAFGVS